MWYLTVCLLLFNGFVLSLTNYTICVLPQTTSYYSAKQICDKLSSTQIRCVIEVDRLGCMKKLNSGEADFAVLEAEDLLITGEDKQFADLLITHRIHATSEKKWEFGVVAVISNKANISKLSDLKGKRLCHPGNDPFSVNYDWSEIFSLYFENRVSPQLCDREVSVEENRIKSLAQFFGDSCRPGVWAADPEVDVALKRKYKSMCSLCDVPSVCSQRDKYWGRQGALYCLSDCLGDVAWSMLKDAKLHFSKGDVSVCGDVSLLCPDGSTMPLNSTEPCVWMSRPVPVIAAIRTKAEEIQFMLKQTLMMPDIPDDFVKLLEANRLTPPLPLQPSITAHDYLAKAPGFLSASTMSVCGQGSRAVSLCVGALQDRIKCEWLSAVSKVFGIQPSLSCVYGANCLVSVANGSADATIADTDLLIHAVRDKGLKPLLVQMPVQLKKARAVSAIVKSSSKITKFSELKGKKACFPSIDGMGWSSFMMHMEKHNLLTGVCPYTKAMSMFFSDICISEPNPAVSMYSNIKVCSTEYSTESWEDKRDLEIISYENEALAFQCLAIGGGDVAFISPSSIPRFLENLKDNPEAEGLTVDSFNTLCDESQAKTGCELGWASFSQVLVHKGLPSSREEDVMSLFAGLSNQFGHHNTPSTRTFNMFAPSNSLFFTSVFSDKTVVQQRLEQYEDFIKKAKLRPKNYETNLKTIEKCSPSTSAQTSYSIFTISFLLCILFSQKY